MRSIVTFVSAVGLALATAVVGFAEDPGDSCVMDTADPGSTLVASDAYEILDTFGSDYRFTKVFTWIKCHTVYSSVVGDAGPGGGCLTRYKVETVRECCKYIMLRLLGCVRMPPTYSYPCKTPCPYPPGTQEWEDECF